MTATPTVQAVFLDANPTLSQVFDQLHDPSSFVLKVNRQPDIKSDEIPAALNGAPIAVIDHTALPTDVARRCTGLKDVVFLGTGARSYMNPEELAELGIQVHTIKGYGDTAVAECAFALMWAAAKDIGVMDRGMRDGQWLRRDALQLTGKTVGLIGFGGIAAEFARLASGIGMQVLAWNRTPREHAGVEFVDLDELLARSDVLSLHLLLNDETRGFLGRERLQKVKPGALLVNTARGALVDEDAMVEALRSGRLGHAGLDVFTVEPMPAGHVLSTLPNVTLSAHSAFRTAEASANLVNAALAHCRRVVGGGPLMAADIVRLDQNGRRSRAVVANGMVFLAGQVADDTTQDIAGQTRQVLAKIDALLEQAGSDRSRLLTAQIWIADMADLVGMNRVWDEWVVPDQRPTRACGQVALTDPAYKLEIVVSALQR